MNERIEKLYDLADKFAKENRVQSIDAPGNNYFELFHEKFAQLIVQECIEMSKLEAAHYSAQAVDAKSKQAFEFEFNSAATCLGVGLRIKKHFGVEE
jgi:hypothetical protein